VTGTEPARQLAPPLAPNSKRDGDAGSELVELVAVRVAAILQQGDGAGVGWLTTAQVARRLSLGERTLLNLRASTPTGIPVPWVKVGRSVRWKADEIDAWMKEIDQWRASTGAGKSGESAGGRRTGRNGSGRARPRRQPAHSSVRLKTQSQSGETGTLVDMVKRLNRNSGK
jgi:predicted DNA-binding transcriptional regulator AlpA